MIIYKSKKEKTGKKICMSNNRGLIKLNMVLLLLDCIYTDNLK